MSRKPFRATRLVLMSILVLMLASMACKLPDLQVMLMEMVMKTIFGDDDFDIPTSDLIELIGQGSTTRVFTGTSDYARIFEGARCPGYKTTENTLAITITEEGVVTGGLRYLYNSGSCEFTEAGETYTQIVEFTVTGTFNGQITGDQGTITLIEDVQCKTIFDSSGAYPPDPDCNIYPQREVDLTISGNHLTGTIRMPANEDPAGFFNVPFVANQN